MKTTPIAPDPAQIRLLNIQTEAHPFCFVCSGSNPMGLALHYEPQADGSVSAKFQGHHALEGAMTNCLFARGIRGLTAELKVRYHESVAASEEVFLQAWLEDDAHELFQLRAKLKQGGVVKASATGKFMKRHE